MPVPDAGSMTSHISPARNGALSPLPSVSLSREHITEALEKSPDRGGTLDLAHKNLTDVGEDGAEELATVGMEVEDESTVVRIALAHNRLATLPMAFALLSRLRYLVLKNNNFTVFPDVLTVMPSLEILDISRNKIKRLPSQPGSLTNLRVFSISRNKIRRLPPYFTKFKHLHLFKVDHNPLEWPPKTVMELPTNYDDSQVMTEWVKSIKQWMESHASTGSERKLSDDSIQAQQSAMEIDADIPADESQEFNSSPHRTHSRSFSFESYVSSYTRPANLQSSSTGVSPSRTTPPRLRLDATAAGPANGTSASPLWSPETYLPTPEDSVSSTDEDTTSTAREFQSNLHTRNIPSADKTPKPPRSDLAAPRSLPDLQTKVFGVAGPTMLVDEFSIPSPPHRQESNSSNGSLEGFRHASTILAQEATSVSPISVDRPAPPMDVERNSYFRRISTLTPAVLAKSIPAPLLKVVDAIRGILFAVSQVYQTLRHYTVFAIDERLSAVLVKVLDPASAYMSQLISALDRFDSMSRRATPPPSVCRAVVESCRDNVTVFGKAVGVLALQLKVLASHDDVRYTRQMLLVLYGAMAEISNAWQAIAGQIELVKPLLRDHRPPPVTAKSFPPLSMRAAPSSTLESPKAPPASAPPVASSPFQSRTLLRSDATENSDGSRGRVSRRHAGSFSYKDVEIGKMLPSYEEPPHTAAGIMGPGALTPTLRTARRMASTGVNGWSHMNGIGGPSAIHARQASHSRQNSQSSLLASSSSSPSLGGSKNSSLEVLSDTNTLVDKEALQAMSKAVDAAPAIWEMMDELLDDAPETKAELSETLSRAKDVTERLTLNIQAVENGDAAADRKTLRDDAHVFVKTVIQLSNVVKNHGTMHPLSATLRTNIVKLTAATQEFLILLNVSSFSSTTPRPYSPMVGIPMPQPSPLPIPEDGRLGASLSRSRSAIPSLNSKLVTAMRDPPRSAMSHNQMFKIPTPPRFGMARHKSGEEVSAVPG